jgi:hypothetical protein
MQHRVTVDINEAEQHRVTVDINGAEQHRVTVDINEAEQRRQGGTHQGGGVGIPVRAPTHLSQTLAEQQGVLRGTRLSVVKGCRHAEHMGLSMCMKPGEVEAGLGRPALAAASHPRANWVTSSAGAGTVGAKALPLLASSTSAPPAVVSIRPLYVAHKAQQRVKGKRHRLHPYTSLTLTNTIRKRSAWGPCRGVCVRVTFMAVYAVAQWAPTG